ncbi:unnamed protein product [Linum trigynum]|uniref:Uncharacterized protein n=1 Tax=Linum trigynum TaxID=586398 RepID=A0AAV2D4N1_9ROSI
MNPSISPTSWLFAYFIFIFNFGGRSCRTGFGIAPRKREVRPRIGDIIKVGIDKTTIMRSVIGSGLMLGKRQRRNWKWQGPITSDLPRRNLRIVEDTESGLVLKF